MRIAGVGVFVAMLLVTSPIDVTAQSAPTAQRLSIAPASTPVSSETLAAIDSLMSVFAARSKVPGIAYGIIADGKVVHIGTSGIRNTVSGAPVDTNSVYRIASMTKSF